MGKVFRCRACGAVWRSDQTLPPQFGRPYVRLCGDASCGTMCDPVPLQRLNAIFDVLVKCAGTPPPLREQFMSSIVGGSNEFRIGGSLGFGGKYWPETNKVTCYPEDETATVRMLMEVTNLRLAATRTP